MTTVERSAKSTFPARRGYIEKVYVASEAAEITDAGGDRANGGRDEANGESDKADGTGNGAVVFTAYGEQPRQRRMLYATRAQQR